MPEHPRAIDVIEWRQDPTDEKTGEALLQLFPVPGPWDGNQRESRFVMLSNMAPTTGLEYFGRVERQDVELASATMAGTII